MRRGVGFSCICVLLFLAPQNQAHAGDYRVMGGIGYGGAGITETPVASTTTTSSSSSTAGGAISKSEGPGVFTVGIEKILSDHYTVMLDHSRGFRLGPASSGVGFTGLTGRYYLSEIPWGALDTKGETVLFIKRYFFYFGLAGGLAQGTITRDADLHPSVTASGIYLGFLAGVDIPLKPNGYGYRIELKLDSTFSSTQADPSSLSLLFLGAQWYFQI